MSVPNKRCPVCVASGHDTGTDSGHLFLMDKGDRWCCNRTVYHPDGMMVFYDNDRSTNEPILDDSETHEDAAGGLFDSAHSEPWVEPKPMHREQPREEYIEFRGVPARVWEEYGVTFGIVDGEPVKQFYPVTLNGKPRTRKVRIIEDKEFYWEDSKKAKKKDLFGTNTLSERLPRRLLITEGEVDAVSARYMLEKWKVKVVSGMDGDSLKNILQNIDMLEKIEDLTFCPDNDFAGNEFCEKLVSLIPHIKVMHTSEKDANDMLRKGKQAEFIDSYFKATNYRPPSIVEVSSIRDSLRDPVPIGISYPWQSLDAITYGINPHTVLSLGSGPGAGKSTLVRSIQEHLMFHHELPVGIFSLEESKELTLRLLVGHQMNQLIHLPGSTYDVDEALHHADRLENKAFIYDRRFFNGRWEKIEKSIRFMYADGIKHFFIDPITALVVHLGSSEQNTALGKIMSDLSALMQELPIYVMLVNHLNNPQTGPGHDEGGRVLPSQFTGSKSQWRFSTDMWGVERDSLSEDEEIKNTVVIRNLKHRTDGSLMGKYIKLKYDSITGRLIDNCSGFTSINPDLTLDKAQKVTEILPKVKAEPKVIDKDITLDDIFGG